MNRGPITNFVRNHKPETRQPSSLLRRLDAHAKIDNAPSLNAYQCRPRRDIERLRGTLPPRAAQDAPSQRVLGELVLPFGAFFSPGSNLQTPGICAPTSERALAHHDGAGIPSEPRPSRGTR
ncbi:uncharacterized protein N7459_009606 [Penicillium hispanicum]|uniref:uncharacterized protein n=1 Tax=Penicillium hispanicum TaxID=1080232 RepID=UPI0025404026|nr:uncharacterized protein N7459_009606 [Penicillium hispanicum]KAJ5570176.1 hypothetical protein N7459_009606 [Penicillium hispanicum]